MSADDAAAVLRELALVGQDDLGHLLRQAVRAVDTATVRRMAELGHDGVRIAHAPVFLHLDPGGTRMVTLAQRVGISRQAIGQLVHDLQESGYLEVVPDPADGRAALVRLTSVGVAFCRQAAAAVRAQEREWEALLGAEATDGLRRALRVLGEWKG
jgi:DNA-binding MarR family transcriptional regulator